MLAVMGVQPGTAGLDADSDAVVPNMGEVVLGLLVLGWLIVAVRAAVAVVRRRTGTRAESGERTGRRRGRLSPLIVGFAGASAAFGVSMLVGAGVLDEQWRPQWLLLAGAGIAVLVIDVVAFIRRSATS